MAIELKTKEQKHQEDLQRLRGMRPIDDDFMRALFKENIPLAQYVLRILTDKPDLMLTSCETQADMKRVTGARSICLDAYGTDTEGKKYDLEIQRADRGANPHRARYHASIMDVENLDAREEFTQLPDTYVIFITEKDFYGKGAPVYVIQDMNLTTGEPFNDGRHILYVNGEYRGADELGDLMHDFNCSNPNDMKNKMLREKSKYYKESKEGIAEMCKMIEEMRNEAEHEKQVVIAIRMLKDGMAHELIVKYTDLSSEEIEALAKELAA